MGNVFTNQIVELIAQKDRINKTKIAQEIPKIVVDLWYLCNSRYELVYFGYYYYIELAQFFSRGDYQLLIIN